MDNTHTHIYFTEIHEFMREEEEDNTMCMCVCVFLPVNEEGFIQAVEHIDDDVVIGDRVDVGTRKLAVNQNALTRLTH